MIFCRRPFIETLVWPFSGVKPGLCRIARIAFGARQQQQLYARGPFPRRILARLADPTGVRTGSNWVRSSGTRNLQQKTAAERSFYSKRGVVQARRNLFLFRRNGRIGKADRGALRRCFRSRPRRRGEIIGLFVVFQLGVFNSGNGNIRIARGRPYRPSAPKTRYVRR